MLKRQTIALMITAVIFFPFATGYAVSVRIASWNMNNLHFVTGKALRPRAPIRIERDFTILREYERRITADVVALQEVNGPRAARRVFSATDYDLYFSGRYGRDMEKGEITDRIYTGFAVRKNVFDAVTKIDYTRLSVAHGKSGRPTRWGVVLKIELRGRFLYLLNVHLKSGCFRASLASPKRNDCVTLAKQIAPLESWIDQHSELNTAFIVLGDFNRAFDVYQHKDHLWQELDDGDPAGLKLWRLPFARRAGCWYRTGLYHADPVDFFVFNRKAWDRVRSGSFKEYDYDEHHRDFRRRTPSDHCPISIDYDL